MLGISGRDGAFAETVVAPERNCHLVPDEISDEQAVFVEPLAAAIQVTKLQSIDRWTHVAVLGSGRLGLLVAQVLALKGCRLEVVGRNPHTLAFCEKRGLQVFYRLRCACIPDFFHCIESVLQERKGPQGACKRR